MKLFFVLCQISTENGKRKGKSKNWRKWIATFPFATIEMNHELISHIQQNQFSAFSPLFFSPESFGQNVMHTLSASREINQVERATMLAHWLQKSLNSQHRVSRFLLFSDSCPFFAAFFPVSLRSFLSLSPQTIWDAEQRECSPNLIEMCEISSKSFASFRLLLPVEYQFVAGEVIMVSLSLFLTISMSHLSTAPYQNELIGEESFVF